MHNNFLKQFAFLILFINLLIGGLSTHGVNEIVGFLSFSLLLLILFNRKSKLIFPPGWIFFIFFISFQLLSLIWTRNIINSVQYLFLFFSGFIIQIFFYNFKKLEYKIFENVIIVLGIIFGMLFIFTQIVPIPFITKYLPNICCNLYAPYSKNHNLIGDFWILITVIGIYRFISGESLLNIILISTSFIFAILSQSRSAFASLLVALLIFLKRSKFSKKASVFIQLFLFISISMFIYISTSKTTIFSRFYYLQGILSLFKNPLGAGMGNFALLTNNIDFNLLLLSTSSAAKAHNILIEVLSGIGILAIVFFFWLFFSLKEVIKNIRKINILYLALFMAISTNFFFNVTYAIPTMLWLWFISLGIIQAQSKNINKK